MGIKRKGARYRIFRYQWRRMEMLFEVREMFSDAGSAEDSALFMGQAGRQAGLGMGIEPDKDTLLTRPILRHHIAFSKCVMTGFIPGRPSTAMTSICQWSMACSAA